MHRYRYTFFTHLFDGRYRLSPEHPYPAALDDVTAVLQHVRSRGQELHVDPARVAVAGDSCGGNLAAATALRMPGQVAMQASTDVL